MGATDAGPGYGLAVSGTLLYSTQDTGDYTLVGQQTASTGAWLQRGIVVRATFTDGGLRGLVVAANGDVYVAGGYNGQLLFGSTVLTTTGGVDMFLAKWSAATSNWAWAVGGGGTNSDLLYGLAVNGTNLYVTGYYASNTAARIGGVSLSGSGGNDIYLAKFVDQGSTVSTGWVLPLGNAGNDQGTSVAVSGSNIYLTGQFSSTFGATIAGNALTGNGGTEAFVAKYIDQGSTVANGWAVSAGGSGVDVALDVAVSGSSVYVSGTFTSGSSAVIAGVPLPGAGGTDAFVAKYTDLGTTANDNWAVSAGGTGADAGLAVAVSGSSVYVSGTYAGPSITAGTTTLPNSGGSNALNDLFVAKYADQGMTASPGWAVSGGGSGDDVAFDIAASGSNVYVTGTIGSIVGGLGGGTYPVVAGATPPSLR